MTRTSGEHPKNSILKVKWGESCSVTNDHIEKPEKIAKSLKSSIFLCYLLNFVYKSESTVQSGKNVLISSSVLE